MEKFYNNIRVTAESEKCSNNDATFKNQKYICIKSNNYKFSTNNNRLVKVEDGKISTNEVVLKKQEGAVIYGIVLFENGTPAPGATVILNLINKNNGRPIPISFAFTDENGVFIFGINDTRYDYLSNYYLYN